jgi:hypothetical protein
MILNGPESPIFNAEDSLALKIGVHFDVVFIDIDRVTIASANLLGQTFGDDIVIIIARYHSSLVLNVEHKISLSLHHMLLNHFFLMRVIEHENGQSIGTIYCDLVL